MKVAESGDAGRRARYSLRSRLLALGIALLAVVVAAECAVRLLYPEEIDPERIREFNRRISIGHLVEPAANPLLLYELKKGLDEEWMGVAVATSETESMRISTIAAPPLEAALRIALLGDSTAFGWGIEYESTYGEVFRDKLQETLRVPVELRNYSVPGYNSLQERICFEEKIAKWRPHILILHYDENDPDPSNTAPPEYIPPEYGDNALHSALVKIVLRRLRVVRNKGSRLYADDSDESGTKMLEGLRYAGPLYDAHLLELSRIARTARSQGIEPVVLMFCEDMKSEGDARTHEHYRLLHEPLAAHLAQAGFHVLDIYEPVQAYLREKNWADHRPMELAPNDRHPTREGHALIAETLHDFLWSRPDLRELIESAASRYSGTLAGEGDVDLSRDYRDAVAALERRDYARAEELLLALLNRYPDDTGLRMRLAEVYGARGEAQKASVQLFEIIRRKPQSVQARVRLALIFEATNKKGEAIRILEEALAHAASENEQGALMRRLAQLFFQAGDFENARRYFDQFVAVMGDPEVSGALLMGEAYFEAGRYAESEAHLKEALRLAPRNESAHRHLADIYTRAGRAREALVHARFLLERHPEDPLWLSRVAWLMSTSPAETDHDAEEAIALALKSCELTAFGNPECLTAVAAAYADAGKFSEAVDMTGRAAAIYKKMGSEERIALTRQLLEEFRAGKPHRATGGP